MILNTTTKSIEVLLGEAITTSNCDVTASYGDYAGSLFLPGASDTVTNGVTAVTAVAAPTASVQRLCNELTVHNNDTVTHRVIVRLNNNGTLRIFRQSDVPPGGDLIYAPGDGGVSEVEPAILLESGTIGAKISALPLFSLTAPPDGSEKSPVVEAAATTAITLAQAYRLTTNWLHYVATNPLDAATVTSAGQDVQIKAGQGGATSGNGGGIALTAGDAPTLGNGGSITLTLGALGGGGVAGQLEVVHLPTTDPAIANAVWSDNKVLVQSGNSVTQTASVVSGSAVSLTSGAALDVTTIALGAGKWLILGAVHFIAAATTTMTRVAGSVSDTLDTMATSPGQFGNQYLAGASGTTLGQDTSVTGFMAEVTPGSPTTYHLVALATFGVSTCTAYGALIAIPVL